MPHQLYPHQEQATEALFEFFQNNETGMPLIVAPVAAGKGILIGEFIKRCHEYYGATNFLVLSHVTELLIQDEEYLKFQWPEASTSFYAAKLGKKSFNGGTVFASINSIYKKAYSIPKKIDIIIIDEAHLISPDAETMYRSFIKDMLVINPELRVIGYTGTNFRPTEGKLTEGEFRLFTDVAYQIPMLYLIEKGFLCPLTTPSVQTKMSTKGVGSSGGDYIESQLQRAVDKDFITKACVDEIIKFGKDRNKWIIFTAGVDHCKHVTEEIKSRGIRCEMVTGKTPTTERNKIVRDYKEGDLQCLVNVGVFTTGFNNPSIDLMAFMRPTRSPVLYVQMGGRGMRISPSKTDCCLLDFGGVISELGPIDLIDAQKVHKSNVPGEAPIKLCPNCNAVCFAGVKECSDCAYQFPLNELALKKTASTMAVLSNQVEPEWHNVLSTSYRLHQKEDKTPTMCVTYNTLDGPYREWICYEHTGYAREKAAKWHSIRSTELLPRKVVDALKLKFKAPKRILTRQSGKYNEIISYDFTSAE